jgi:dTDP-glucose pyrophosphorylase
MHYLSSSKIKTLMVKPDCPLRTAIEIMTGATLVPMILVVEDGRLLGIIVDYDIRKAMLGGVGMDATVSRVMNPKPVCLPSKSSSEDIQKFFLKSTIRAVPLVDEDECIQGLARRADYSRNLSLPNRVVIMAGGRGKRLHPITSKVPKPMIRMGGLPLLEHIIRQLITFGFYRFTLSIGYKSHLIKEYFNNSDLMVNIDYIEEEKPLGTAGSLSLLNHEEEHSILVMNGDILTNLNFMDLFEFHDSGDYNATVCVRQHLVDIPYGVIDNSGPNMIGFTEKPVYSFLVNAGIYVLNPEILTLAPKGEALDMPDLLIKIKSDTGKVGCFPISEYWLDIGQPQQLKRAREDFNHIFSNNNNK